MLCSPFVVQEIGALSGAGLLSPGFATIAVGNDADGFLRLSSLSEELLPRRLGKLRHYGAYRFGRFNISESELPAFEEFRAQHENCYRDFVREHVPWDLAALEHEIGADMKILFCWNRQLAPWRARL